MNREFRRIENLIKLQFYRENVTDKEIIGKYIESGINDYKKLIEEGKTEDEAIDIIINSLKVPVLKERKKTSKFIYYYSLTYLLIGLLINLMSIFDELVIDTYKSVYPFLFIGVSIFFVYTLVTHKKRNKIDIIIAIITFIASLTMLIESILFLYQSADSSSYYELVYIFPGILKFNTFTLTSIWDKQYELTNTIYLFDPTLIVGVIAYITSLIDYKTRNKKTKGAV